MKRLLRERLVLIVDDVPLNLLILEQILQAASAKVLKAQNGREALALLDDHPVDIILTDLQMPELDGWEMAASIRKSDKWYRQLPIIATTAETDEADLQKCLAAGINEVVYKPVDPDRILQKIEDILTGNENRSAAHIQKEPNTTFDLSYLEEVTNGDQECFLLIVDNLKENGPLLLVQATESIRKSNWTGAAGYLHKLKGLTALFGMCTITNTLMQAEQEAKTNNPSSAQMLEKIDWVTEQLTTSLQQITHLTQTG